LEKDTIEVTFGLLGTNSLTGNLALSSALGRPLKRLFDTGKPIGRINWLFFQPPTGPLRTLGTLCYTPGKQVLFYPGLNVRRIPWYTRGNKKIDLVTKPDESLDHITLKKDLNKWHATILTRQGFKETTIPSMRTQQISKDLIFWFALSIRGPSVLELMPNTVTLGPFPVSSRDSKRRVEEIINARKQAVHHITRLHDGETLSSGEFVTFEFYLDLASRIRRWLVRHLLGRRPWYGTRLVFPVAFPAVSKPLRIPDSLPYRTHDVTVSGFRGRLIISVYKAAGILAEDSVLSGY